MKETMDDAIARLNLEGRRGVWVNNRKSIEYVVRRTRRYWPPGKEACEVGVGEGYLIRRLCGLGYHVVGVDHSAYLVQELGRQFREEKLPVEMIQADFASMDLGRERFDMAFCLDVLEHIPGDGLAAGLTRLRDALKLGGLLVATVPLGENLDHGMVVCPECGHRFHRVGHRHSFADVAAVAAMLPEGLRLVEARLMPEKMFPWPWANSVVSAMFRAFDVLRGREPTGSVCFVARREHRPTRRRPS